MAAIFLRWNTNLWNRWGYPRIIEHVAESGRFLDRWQVNPGEDIRPETEVWLLLVGSSEAGTGLIGHGVVMSEPFEAPAAPDSETSGWYASVAFDALLPLGDQLRSDVLSAAVPGVRWSSVFNGSSMTVPASAESDLRRLWQDCVPVAGGPGEVLPGTYPPGAVSSVEVNRYERNPDARRACLAFHGTSCAACGFSFESFYGEIGTGFTEVHHLVPPALLGSGYELDPVADLVPLCANCHAMAHRNAATPRSVQELRNSIAAAGHLRGEVVTARALEAQENAARLLEGRHD